MKDQEKELIEKLIKLTNEDKIVWEYGKYSFKYSYNVALSSSHVFIEKARYNSDAATYQLRVANTSPNVSFGFSRDDYLVDLEFREGQPSDKEGFDLLSHLHKLVKDKLDAQAPKPEDVAQAKSDVLKNIILSLPE